MQHTPSEQEIASKWAEYTIKKWLKNLNKLKIGKTDELSRSFRDKILSSGDTVSKIQFTYAKQGMFTDMGVGRGQKISGIKGNKEVLRASGIRGKSEGRHAKKWYSKTMYAETLALADLMQEHYGITAQNLIIENIPNKI